MSDFYDFEPSSIVYYYHELSKNQKIRIYGLIIPAFSNCESDIEANMVLTPMKKNNIWIITIISVSQFKENAKLLNASIFQDHIKLTTDHMQRNIKYIGTSMGSCNDIEKVHQEFYKLITTLSVNKTLKYSIIGGILGVPFGGIPILIGAGIGYLYSKS